MGYIKRLRTHKDLVKHHGAFVVVHYRKTIQCGRLSVYNGGQMVYFCFEHESWGRSQEDLKITETFGYKKARMISHKNKLSRYERKPRLTKKIFLVEEETRTMKSILKTKKTNKEIKYPCLMRSTKTKGLVVLMTTCGIGTVVVCDDRGYYGVGTHSDSWNDSVFERLDNEDKVILQND